MEGLSSIPELARNLSDTALALLLSLAAGGHCRFTYDLDTGEHNPLKTLVKEIETTARDSFGLVARLVNLQTCTFADSVAEAMGVSVGTIHLPQVVILYGLQDANEEVAGFIVEMMRSKQIELSVGTPVVPGRWFCVVDVVEKGLGHKAIGVARHAVSST